MQECWNCGHFQDDHRNKTGHCAACLTPDGECCDQFVPRPDNSPVNVDNA